MHMQSKISALTLAVALAAVPVPAAAQLSLGVNLGGNSDQSGAGLGVGVDLGVGGQNLNVDAGVSVGGDGLVDANANVGTSSGSSSSGASTGGNSGGISVGAEVLGNDGLVDAEVNVTPPQPSAPQTPSPTGNSGSGSGSSSGGSSNTSGISIGAEVLGNDGLVEAEVTVPTRQAPSASPGPAPAPAQPAPVPVIGVAVSALSNTARVDALIGQIRNPQMGDGNLDDIIDDRSVSIIALADLLDEDGLADIRAELLSGGSGRGDLLAAIEGSVELGSILDREGIGIEDVVSVSVNSAGHTEVVILGGGLDLADGGAGAPLGSTDLADLDIGLLTDKELAEIDLALLPNEDQRLDAIIRLLGRGESGSGNGSGNGAGNGQIQLIDVDALLGEESLAELDAILGGGEGGEDVLITADLLDQLNAAGLSPEAVIGIDSRDDGVTHVFINAGLGENGGLLGSIADVDIAIGGGTSGGDGGNNGGGDGGNNGGGDGGNNGGGDGGNNGGGDGGNNGGGDGGNNDGGDGGNNGGGDGGNNGGGDGGNNGGGVGGNNGTGGNGGTGNGSGTGGGGVIAVNTEVPAALLDPDMVVAEVSCLTGLEALSSVEMPTPADLRDVEDVSLVSISGCVQVLRQDELAALKAAVQLSNELSLRVDEAGLDLGDLVGGTLDDGVLTLYFETAGAASSAA